MCESIEVYYSFPYYDIVIETSLVLNYMDSTYFITWRDSDGSYEFGTFSVEALDITLFPSVDLRSLKKQSVDSIYIRKYIKHLRINGEKELIQSDVWKDLIGPAHEDTIIDSVYKEYWKYKCKK